MWVQIVLYIILNLPKLIGVIKEIIDLIKGMPKAQRDAVRFPIINAIIQHMKDKDDAKLEAALKVCHGVACAPQLVGP